MAKQVGYLCDISVVSLNAEDISKALEAASKYVAITGFKVTAHPKERVMGCVRTAQFFEHIVLGATGVAEVPKALADSSNIEGNVHEGDYVEDGSVNLSDEAKLEENIDVEDVDESIDEEDEDND